VVPVDVRVVAATNKDQGPHGRREGRERREDVPLLADHFAAKLGRADAAVTPPVRDLLVGYGWPGNVRELENVIARALALNPSGVIVPEDLPEAIRRAVPPPLPALSAGERPTLSELERRCAAQVLAEQGGNKTRAAEVLGIDRKTFYRILGERDEERTGTGA
jgi:two-component system, NtrC family, response regulator AtoC